MDAVVHHDVPSRGRGVLRVWEPGVQQYGNVVIPVQEDQRLLAQHDEDRVTEFGYLRQHEHPRPEARYAVLLDKAAIELFVNLSHILYV